MDGLLLIDKPAGITSHDVVDRVRRIAGQRSVGHAGTLDPPATGVLVLLLGKGTRLAEYAEADEKEYRATFRFGVETDTLDASGKVLAEEPCPPLEIDAVRAAAFALTGEIAQTPPAVSAIRVGGRRLYERARRGEPAEAPPRRVTVHEFEILSLDPPRAEVRIRCTKGTYVRALARDLGRALGCGAIAESLRRVRSGAFRIEDAAPLEGLDREGLLGRLLPLEAAVSGLPRIDLDAEAAVRIRQGRALEAASLPGAAGPVPGANVRLHGPEGELIAIGAIEGDPAKVRPRKVFLP